MKGTSKVIMGATLAMVVILAMVLGLVLVLLAELYCSLLLRRRRQLQKSTSITTTTGDAMATNSSSQPQQLQGQSAGPQPLGSFFAHGVLLAPRSILFPAVHGKEDNADIEKQHSQLYQFFESTTQEPSTTPHRIGVFSPSPPSPSFSLEEFTIQGRGTGGAFDDSSSSCDGENLVYISNPIYDNYAGRKSSADTPFETPDTSPSRLETGGSSVSSSDKVDQSCQSSPSSVQNTPPLTPMKKLPEEACSVSLRDARSLATSGSDSNSNNRLSSSSSGSPCTSPSW